MKSMIKIGKCDQNLHRFKTTQKGMKWTCRLCGKVVEGGKNERIPGARYKETN
jgi:hypothetical protein